MLTGWFTKARILGKIKSWFRPLTRASRDSLDGFLNDVSGVVHVGANIGDERKLYRAHGLSVVWVEPVPEVFAHLKARIRGYKNQKAFQALVTDVDDKEYTFYISNNMEHPRPYSNLSMSKISGLTLTTLQACFSKASLWRLYSSRSSSTSVNITSLIMDTQGSELPGLAGSLPILNNFKFIKTEVRTLNLRRVLPTFGYPRFYG